MPLYEYRCIECEETTEKLVMGENPDPAEHTPLACPHCGMQGGMRLALNSAGLKFKGVKGHSGFHTLDYPTQNVLGTKTKVAMSSQGKGGRRR